MVPKKSNIKIKNNQSRYYELRLASKYYKQNKTRMIKSQQSKYLYEKFLKKNIFSKFINFLMKDGKKSKAEKIFFEVLKHYQSQKINAMARIVKAIYLSKPLLIIKTQKKRKMLRVIPKPLNEKKQLSYGFLYLMAITRKRKKQTMAKQLIQEFNNIINNTGPVIEYKKQIYSIAESNKLLTRYNK